jgi:hypothetical protein
LGSRCDQNSNKKKAIELLNTIIGKDDYKTDLDIPQIVICILQELYLRSFEETLKNKKHWFYEKENMQIPLSACNYANFFIVNQR